MNKPAADFYQIQAIQKRKSLLVFAAIMVLYFCGFGLIALAAVWSFGLALSREIIGSSFFWTKFLAVTVAIAGITAFLHFEDARRNGGRYVLRRLQAREPDRSDRYHLEFLNVLEEMRLAAGLPAVRGYLLPYMAVNSLAVIENEGKPAVIATEGLLAVSTRDELQAAIAHELAHLIRGDTFYVTLVCSLAEFFEKIRDALEPDRDDVYYSNYDQAAAGAHPSQAMVSRGGGWAPLLLLPATALSGLVMRLLSALISRQREFLADAAAVEICRSPEALARILIKAHLNNSFVGDFSDSYGPLFMVRPQPHLTEGSSESRLFRTHPPLEDRIAALAPMARKQADQLVNDIIAGERLRDNARFVLPSGPPPTNKETGAQVPDEPNYLRIWMILAGDDSWEGPFSTSELLDRPGFSSLAMVRNIQEQIEAKAREFSQIKLALRTKAGSKTGGRSGGSKLCPRCGVLLHDSFYEGVPVRICPECGGRLIDMGGVDRIIVRREFAFSEELLKKAGEFEETMARNPLRMLRQREKKLIKKTRCPACGWPMVERPFNYQYFIPVDKCLSCSRIWFDTDELEILQILIESRGSRKPI